jgi:general nucleoside transport system permease protein
LRLRKSRRSRCGVRPDLIAVALLARLHPVGVTLAALFFGALGAGSGAMQRVAGVSAVFVAIVQGATLLALLALEAPRLRPPVPAEHQ